MSKIHQIHHVARCGSTLLTFLLSQVSEAYSECGWSNGPLVGADPFKTIDRYYNTVVKFPSMISALPVRFEGKKVFLYRPLSQHLCKMKSVDPEWLNSRETKIDYIISNVRHPAIASWKVDNLLDKVACLWACSVVRMLETEEVLWIQTNDFIENKREIVNKVCNHFGLEPVPNLHVSDIDVKKIGINGRNDPIHISLNNSGAYINPTWVPPTHGLIKTELAMLDPDIRSRLDYVESSFPTLIPFLY